MKATEHKNTTISINSKLLATALATLSKVIMANPIVPIIENVHASTHNGILTLKASDMRTTLVTTLAYNQKIGETDTVFLIPHKLSLDLLKSLPDIAITMEHQEVGINNSFKLTFRFDKQKYSMETESPVDFPKAPDINGEEFELPADQLQEGLKYCLNAVSDDDFRPAMQGVYFDTDSSSNITLVSTNGHAIIMYEMKVSGIEKVSFILRSSAAQAVLDIISPSNETITITKSINAVKIDLGSYIIISQQIDERYPDFNSAVPKDYPNTVSVNLNDWRSLVNRSILFANRTTGGIRNGFSNGKLNISSEDMDYNTESNQEIEIDSDSPFEATAIGINGKLMQKVTRPASGLVNVSFSTHNRMLLLSVPNSLAESIKIGIMPVMLAEHATL